MGNNGKKRDQTTSNYSYTETLVENKISIEAGKPRTAPRVGLINCGAVSYTHLDVYKRQS